METERFEMRAPADWLAAIDEWRNGQPIPPSRAAAIRYLVEAGLKACRRLPIRATKPELRGSDAFEGKPRGQAAQRAATGRSR